MLSPHERLPDFERQVVAKMAMLRRFALKLCRNTDRAEDLLQETVLKALSHRDSFELGSNMGAWLTTIMRNTFYTELRKHTETEDVDDVLSRNMVAPATDPTRALEAVETLKLVELLPETFRLPLLLIADGASYEEVADEMHEHVGTIKSRANRGRAILKAAS